LRNGVVKLIECNIELARNTLLSADFWIKIPQHFNLTTMASYIVLTGKRASGKDYFCKYSQQKFHIPTIRFSTVIGDLGVKHGLVDSFSNKEKAKLQYLGNYFRKKYGEEFYVKELAKQIKGENYTINGSRAVQEPALLEKYLGEKITLVAIVTSDKNRFHRGLESNLVKDYKEFLKFERNKAEAPIDELIKMAKIKIDNNGTKEEFEKKIDEFWFQYNKK